MMPGKALLLAIAAACLCFAGAAQAATPPKRYVLQALFPERAEAEALARAVRAGAKFDQAAAAFGLSAKDVKFGGTGVTTEAEMNRWMREPAVADAIFRSQEGAVVGPIRSSLGWHVAQSFGVAELRGPWFPVATGIDFNVETLTGDHRQRRVWVRYTETTRKGSNLLMAFKVFDCMTGRSAMVTSNRYVNGNLVSKSETVPEALVTSQMEPIAPDTVGATLHRLVCSADVRSTRQ